jgi:ABC-type transport system involved in multi-copper enzyme maturation permease subunit
LKAVVLIAINFVREQRWPILVLLLWVVLLALLGLKADLRAQRDDLLGIFQWVSVYVVAFSMFFGGSAIYTERRSRRILAVISKAISRKRYLSGLVLGVAMASAINCFALGLTGSWTLGEAGFPVSQIWFLMLCVLCACTLAGTVAMMFSTFLNPFLAAGASAAVLLSPAIPLAMHGDHRLAVEWAYAVPAYALTQTVVHASFDAPGHIYWLPIVLAVAEIAGFWLVAAQIFSRVDIAVAVE